MAYTRVFDEGRQHNAPGKDVSDPGRKDESCIRPVEKQGKQNQGMHELCLVFDRVASGGIELCSVFSRRIKVQRREFSAFCRIQIP